MGSVTRRFKRNIQAKGMALHAGIVPRVIEYRHPETKEVVGKHFPTPVAPINYRAWMLRTAAMFKRQRQQQHHLEQVRAGRKGKVRRFFGGWKRSWFLRMLDKILPSMAQAREERKARKLKRQADPNNQARIPNHHMLRSVTRGKSGHRG